MLRVLIVDDSKTDREILLGNLPERLFRECDFLEADSVAMARRVLAIKDVDVIALDLSLPDSDGFETFFAMKQIAKGAAIVILSGNEDDSLAKKLIEHGADSYILKGTVDPKGVYRTLTNAAVRAKHTVRVTEDEAFATRRAQTAARNMLTSHKSGQMAAVKETSVAEAISTNTELTVLILEKQARLGEAAAEMKTEVGGIKSDISELKDVTGGIQSDFSELKNKYTELKVRLDNHDGEKARLSAELDVGRKEMKSFSNEFHELKTAHAVATTKHELFFDRLRDGASHHRGKLATGLTTLATSPFWGPKVVEGIVWLVKHFAQ